MAALCGVNLLYKLNDMETQETINYNRIADAINYIKQNFKGQPNLDEVAEKVHLSPYHFQRLFTDWAGISPKKFLQYLSVEYAKEVLQEKQATLFDTAFDTGLSGTGRLHDLFINLEGMTPAEYKNGGKALTINYSFAESPFGDIIVASTLKGICYLAFADDKQSAFAQLQQKFPNAAYRQYADAMQQNALFIFREDCGLNTYANVAHNIDSPTASRAVGSAIGQNPVAFLIPCHRVIKSTGESGQYHWGATRKSAIIGWEAAKTHALSA
jgi:AraC family transcriptional regulator of adaptative response/methylated-DNA-[protein]-cysteine methyltransferase